MKLTKVEMDQAEMFETQAHSLEVRYITADHVECTKPLAEVTNHIDFETCQPIRKSTSYVGQMHMPGFYWAATTKRLVPYESRLEASCLTVLDFETDVIGIAAQPCEMNGVDDLGTWRHTPDVFVRLRDGLGMVVDVKPRSRLSNPEVALQFARTKRECDAVGFEYRVMCEPERQLWSNISWLSGFRRPIEIGDEWISSVLGAAERSRPIRELAQAAGDPSITLPVVFHLCWTRVLDFDLERPLRASTPIRLTKATT